MAKLVQTVETEWDKCVDCPFCHSGYTGSDGFGMRDTYNADYCSKGHFGKKVGTDFSGRDLWDSSVKAPDCIPPQCQYHDNPWKPEDDYTLIQCVQMYSDKEIMELVKYFRSEKHVEDTLKYLSEKEEQQRQKKQQKAYNKYAKNVVKHLEEQGYNVLDSFKESIKED